MICDLCGEHWSYNRLCPTCWSDFVNKTMPDQEWKCGVCGEDVILKGIDIDGGFLLQQVTCKTCKVVYLPEGGQSEVNLL